MKFPYAILHPFVGALDGKYAIETAAYGIVGKCALVVATHAIGGTREPNTD